MILMMCLKILIFKYGPESGDQTQIALVNMGPDYINNSRPCTSFPNYLNLGYTCKTIVVYPIEAWDTP